MDLMDLMGEVGYKSFYGTILSFEGWVYPFMAEFFYKTGIQLKLLFLSF